MTKGGILLWGAAVLASMMLTVCSSAAKQIPTAYGWQIASPYICLFADSCTTSSSGGKVDIQADLLMSTGPEIPSIYIEGLVIRVSLHFGQTTGFTRVNITFVRPTTTLTNNPLFVLNGLTFKEGSSFTIDGAQFAPTYTNAPPLVLLGGKVSFTGSFIMIRNAMVTNGRALFASYTKELVLENTTFEISNSTIQYQAATSSTLFSRALVNLEGVASLVTMSTGSRIALRGNNLTFGGATPLSTTAVAFVRSLGTFSLSGNSSIAIEDNNLLLSAFTEVVSAILVGGAVFDGGASIGGASSLTITNNSLSVNNGVASLNQSVIAAAWLTMRDVSVFRVTQNSLTSTTATCNNCDLAVAVGTLSVVSLGKSAVILSSNTLHVERGSGSTTSITAVAMALNLGSLDLSQSQLVLSDNTVFADVRNNVFTFKGYILFVMSLFIGADTDSKLLVSGNVLNVTDGNVTTYNSAVVGVITLQAVPSRYSLMIKGNILRINAEASVLTVKSTVLNSTISLCDNEVNGVAFEKGHNVNTSGNVRSVACGAPTQTHEPGFRTSSHTQSSTNVTTTSITAALSNTPSPPRSSTLPGTRTTSDATNSTPPTATGPPPTLSRNTPSESDSPSPSHTKSPSPTPTPTPSVTPTQRCAGMSRVSNGCELFNRVEVVGAMGGGNATTSTASNICDSQAATIPYSAWSSSGNSALIRMWFADGVDPFVTTTISNTSTTVSNSIERKLLGVKRNATSPSARAWLEISVRYLGSNTLSGTHFTVDVYVGSATVTCGVGAAGVYVSLAVWLEAAPPIPSDVSTTVDVGVATATATSAVVGATSGMVRAGLANNMLAMLECSEFDPTSTVDLISNPFSWAVGREELQYQRGSLLIALITLLCALVVCVCVVTGYFLSDMGAGLDEAMQRARFPSLPLAAVLLLCEVAVSPSMNVLLYSGSQPGDYVLAFAVLVPLGAYLGLYAFRSSIGMQVIIEELPGDSEERMKMGGKAGLLLRYFLEPTHCPVAIGTRKEAMQNDDDDDKRDLYDDDRQGLLDTKASERWLRGNFYFVVEKRWAFYGAAEAIIGPIVGLIEGIPLTSSNTAACIARPAAMCVLLAVLLFLLVWKHPFAVRLQQWTSLIVTSGLLVASTLVVTNAAAPSETLQEGAARTISAVSVIIMFFGLLDVVAVIMTLIPSISLKLGLKPRSMQQSFGTLLRGAALSSELLILADQRPTDDAEAVLSVQSSDRSTDEEGPEEVGSESSDVGIESRMTWMWRRPTLGRRNRHPRFRLSAATTMSTTTA